MEAVTYYLGCSSVVMAKRQMANGKQQKAKPRSSKLKERMEERNRSMTNQGSERGTSCNK